jgi:hypothetical protein
MAQRGVRRLDKQLVLETAGQTPARAPVICSVVSDATLVPSVVSALPGEASTEGRGKVRVRTACALPSPSSAGTTRRS